MVVRQNILPGRNPLLELCPFCGEPGEIFFVDGEAGCRVRCSNKDCSFKPCSQVDFQTEELAIKAWNTHKGGLNARGDVRSVRDAIIDAKEQGLLF